MRLEVIALQIFLPALAAGFCIAATPGPLALLCTHRILERGFWSGLRTGSGIATGDAVWTVVAALAWSRLSTVFDTPWTGRVAGLALVAMAAHLWHHRPASSAARKPRSAAEYWSAVGWTVANPMTVVTMAALMAAFGAHVPVVPFVGGLTLGSLLWWTLLSLGVSGGRGWITPDRAHWLSRAGAVLILIWGLRALLG